MTSFKVTTDLNCPFETARQHFDRRLFETLIKGFPHVLLERFDGIYVGAHTVLRLFFSGGPIWDSVITDLEDGASKFEFTDEGVILPFGMKKWVHKHSLIATSPKGCSIEDHISLECTSSLHERLLAMAFQHNMQGRQKVYQRYFAECAKHP
jgi:ligand-binding SRPBCC domain-containing protein